MAYYVDQIQQVKDRIKRAQINTPYAESKVKLIAVSKKQPLNKIQAAIEAGVTDFGESYIQEAVEKIKQFDSKKLTWHFIGPIQSNKTNLIAKHFSWVHSVDRFKIAERLSRQRELNQEPLNILLQVNISEEQEKSGVSPSEVEALCEAVSTLPNLKLRGLMAMSARAASVDLIRAQYAKMHSLFTNLQEQNYPLTHLSMGMTNDFEIAVACGANMVRIGTLIFGQRST